MLKFLADPDLLKKKLNIYEGKKTGNDLKAIDFKKSDVFTAETLFSIWKMILLIYTLILKRILKSILFFHR